MQYDSSESSTQTDRRLKKHKKFVNGVVNARPILGFRVRQADETLSPFDILRIVDSIEEIILAIDGELSAINQLLAFDLCSQVIEVLVKDIPENGIVDIEDLRVQIEMALTLNRRADLARAYREAFSA